MYLSHSISKKKTEQNELNKLTMASIKLAVYSNRYPEFNFLTSFKIFLVVIELQISGSEKKSELKKVNKCTHGINFCERHPNMNCRITFFLHFLVFVMFYKNSCHRHKNTLFQVLIFAAGQ